MIEYVDIIVGLSWGDEGKGKICASMSKEYDYVCRFNGGNNAGHTIWINDQKIVTHSVPSGIVHNKKCIIGPNCVLNYQTFLEEMDYLSNLGFDTNLVKISPKTHIILEEHIHQDKKYYANTLGTTSKGIGPCYAAKALRTGIQAKDLIDHKYIWDEKLSGSVLCEGAQSFWLDINQGNYPYCTSSECLPYTACSLGFSPKSIDRIIGVAKIYDTRSGTDPIFPETLLNDEQFEKIISEGQEYGTTTGRKRKVNWLNLSKLITAIEKSGATELIINKSDILEKLNIFKLYLNNELIEFPTLDLMQEFIISTLDMNFEDLIVSFNSTKFSLA